LETDSIINFKLNSKYAFIKEGIQIKEINENSMFGYINEENVGVLLSRFNQMFISSKALKESISINKNFEEFLVNISKTQ
jgi:hypothetical protein